MMFSSVPDFDDCRLSLNAMPTDEKRRSTEAEDAGHPSGVKPSISGDLWSDNGMGLFGIYAHGMNEDFM